MKTLDRPLLSLTLLAVLATAACKAEGSALALSEPAGTPPVKDDALSFDIAFGTHLDMELPEQDAYIERTPGSGEVWRVTLGDNDMQKPLFRTAVPVRHDPFDPAALGPWPKGEPLGLTLGQWLKQSGRGRYSSANGVGRLELTFTNLVPHGVYTLWHSFMALPPTTPFSGTLDLPVGARDGSECVFVADEKGNAEVVRTVTPGLQMSDVWTTAMLAVNYHSDGKAHGGVPGDFGLNAHVPLFMILPRRAGIE